MLTIDELLLKAKEEHASDLHITVGVPPKLRIYGKLKNMDYPKLLPADIEALVNSFITPKQKAILDEKGQADFSYSIANLGRYRVNAYKQRGSYALAFRLVSTNAPSPEELGLSPSVVDLANRQRGLVLVTGPTGSGKSTTLASLIDVINNSREAHVITLEDPIEYLHNHKLAMVNQREIGIDSNSYADALRAALREDPDVILVGEMRDLETISIAITAAETGHLVFSTLHTIGAASTIDRIIDVFPPHQQQQIRIQLSMVVESVISQQLLPTAHKAGRVAAFEVMHANPAIRNLIREGKTFQISSVIQTNKKNGMQTMDDALIELYYQGKISYDDAYNYAQNQSYVAQKLGGI